MLLQSDEQRQTLTIREISFNNLSVYTTSYLSSGASAVSFFIMSNTKSVDVILGKLCNADPRPNVFLVGKHTKSRVDSEVKIFFIDFFKVGARTVDWPYVFE